MLAPDDLRSLSLPHYRRDGASPRTSPGIAALAKAEAAIRLETPRLQRPPATAYTLSTLSSPLERPGSSSAPCARSAPLIRRGLGLPVSDAASICMSDDSALLGTRPASTQSAVESLCTSDRSSSGTTSDSGPSISAGAIRDMATYHDVRTFFEGQREASGKRPEYDLRTNLLNSYKYAANHFTPRSSERELLEMHYKLVKDDIKESPWRPHTAKPPSPRLPSLPAVSSPNTENGRLPRLGLSVNGGVMTRWPLGAQELRSRVHGRFGPGSPPTLKPSPRESSSG